MLYLPSETLLSFQIYFRGVVVFTFNIHEADIQIQTLNIEADVYAKCNRGKYAALDF